MADSGVRRWSSTALAAVCVAVAVFALFTALGLGKGSSGTPRAPTPEARFAVFSLEAPHVLSSYSIHSLQGLGGAFQPAAPNFLPTMSASQFDRPIALYRRYGVAQLGLMEIQVETLEHALAANDRTASMEAWRASYARYLKLGAVYLAGQLAALNQEINGSAEGLPGGVANPHFVGLHRIEYGLWNGASPRSLLGWAGRLHVAVGTLRRLLPSVSITPLEYATRAHEILEDAQRDLLSGADVPWSGEGLLATEAGLGATEEVISTLHPYLASEDSEDGEQVVGPAVDTELATLRKAIAAIAAAHGGRPPTNAQLTQQQSELLDGSLGGALEALSQVPGALEAEPLPHFVPIPAREARIDP
jgi:iron uptake system EfeUOB component EfeO/EfeM